MALPKIENNQEKINEIRMENLELTKSIKTELVSINRSLNMKLGSMVMMISEFLEMSRRQDVQESLLENNRPLSDNSNEEQQPSGISDKLKSSISDLSAEDIGLAGIISTALAALTFSSLDWDKAIAGSGLIQKILSPIGKGANKFLNSINIFKRVDSLIVMGDKVKGFFSMFKGLFTFVGNMTGVSYLGGVLSGAMKFVPFLRMFTGLISFVQGFIDGYKENESLFEGFREGFSNLAADFIGWPLELLKDLSSWLLDKFGFLTDEQKERFDDFDFIEAVRKSVRSAFNYVKSLIENPVETLRNTWNSLMNGATNLTVFISNNVLKPLGNWFESLFKNPIKTLKELWNSYTNTTHGQISLFIYDKAIKPLLDWFDDLFKNPVDTLTNLWNSYLDTPHGKLNIFIYNKTIKPLIDWIGDKFNVTKDALSNIVGSTWTNVTDKISGVWSRIRTFFSTKLTFIAGNIDEKWKGLTSWIGERWQWVKGFWEDMNDFQRDKIERGKNLMDIVGEKWGNLKGWMGEKIDLMVSTFQSKMETISTLIQDIPEKLKLKAREMIANLGANLEIGFLKFGNWFSTLPDQLAAMILNSLSQTRGLGFLEGVADRMNTNFSENENDLQDRIAQINAEKERSLREIARERASLESNQAKNPNVGIGPINVNRVTGGSSSSYSFNGSSGSDNTGDPRPDLSF